MKKIFLTLALVCTALAVMAVPEGALPYPFSVGEAGLKVYMSQGNLIAIGPSRAEVVFRFQNPYYPFVETHNGGSQLTGNVSFSLFGRSVSASTHVEENGSYSEFVQTSLNESVYLNETMNIEGTDREWVWGRGIVNGGKKSHMWRTMSRWEFQYLLKSRPDASKLAALVRLCVWDKDSTESTIYEGLMLWPDGHYPTEYAHPNTIQTLDWYTSRGLAEDFTGMDEVMFRREVNENGAAWLPCEGYRSGITVKNKDLGVYWTSEPAPFNAVAIIPSHRKKVLDNSNSNEEVLYSGLYIHSSTGACIRAVMSENVARENQMYTIQAYGPNHYDNVTGGGTYAYGTEVTLKAEPKNNSRIFTGWDDGVKTPERTVTVLSDRTYFANFRAKATYDVTYVPTSYDGTDIAVRDAAAGESAWKTLKPGTKMSFTEGSEILLRMEGTVSTTLSYEGIVVAYNNDKGKMVYDTICQEPKQSYNSKSVSIKLDHPVVVRPFTRQMYAFSVSSNNTSWGTVTSTVNRSKNINKNIPKDFPYLMEGDTYEVNATPAAGYEFVAWSNTSGSMETYTEQKFTRTFKSEGNLNLSANFRKISTPTSGYGLWFFGDPIGDHNKDNVGADYGQGVDVWYAPENDLLMAGGRIIDEKGTKGKGLVFNKKTTLFVNGVFELSGEFDAIEVGSFCELRIEGTAGNSVLIIDAKAGHTGISLQRLSDLTIANCVVVIKEGGISGTSPTDMGRITVDTNGALIVHGNYQSTTPSTNYISKFTTDATTSLRYPANAAYSSTACGIVEGSSTSPTKNIVVVAPDDSYIDTYTKVYVNASTNLKAEEGCTTTGSGYYAPGKSFTVTAVPSQKYRFVGWQYAGTDFIAWEEPTYSSEVSVLDLEEGKIDLVAVFEPNGAYVEGRSTDEELGEVEGISGWVAYGSEVEYVAIPATGCELYSWIVNGNPVWTNDLNAAPGRRVSSAENPYKLKVSVSEENTLVEAVFTITERPAGTLLLLSVNDDKLGHIDGNNDYIFLPDGESVTVTAVAESNAEFTGWSDGVTEAVRTFTAGSEKKIEVEAIFDSLDAVEMVDGKAEGCTKFIRNGQVYILRNGEVYNVLGTKVE